jgi:hypothetical protein
LEATWCPVHRQTDWSIRRDPFARIAEALDVGDAVRTDVTRR